MYGFQFLAIGAWNAYATVYFEARGLPLALIGVLAAVPAAVAIVASPAWGLVADRLGDMRPPYLVASAVMKLASSAALVRTGPSFGRCLRPVCTHVGGVYTKSSGARPSCTAESII